MPLLCFRSSFGLLALTLGLVSLSFAQDENVEATSGDSALGEFAGVGVVPKLTISRKDIPNFLHDEELIARHLPNGADADIPKATLRGLFTIGADSSRYAFFWDPLTCRFLGVLDLDPSVIETTNNADEVAPPDSEDGEDPDEEGDENAGSTPPSPFFLLAAGPHPLSSIAGGSGDSTFFGVRLVEGKPEFLYEQGSLLVEERLWLENEGKTLQQHFTLRDMDSPLVIKLPESWRERVKADRGEWKDNLLTVPRDESDELRLTYQLSIEGEEPETEKEEVE